MGWFCVSGRHYRFVCLSFLPYACVYTCVCEERERVQDKTRQDKIILLSGLRPITTGVNIQAIRILMDSMTDLNSVF